MKKIVIFISLVLVLSGCTSEAETLYEGVFSYDESLVQDDYKKSIDERNRNSEVTSYECLSVLYFDEVVNDHTLFYLLKNIDPDNLQKCLDLCNPKNKAWIGDFISEERLPVLVVLAKEKPLGIRKSIDGILLATQDRKNKIK